MDKLFKVFDTRWPALLWTLGIFILLSIPGGEFGEPPRIPNLDKLIHAFLCGIHVWLWCRYLHRRLKDRENRNRLFFLVFVITCIYGILLEYHQKYFVPNRGFDYKDMVADAAGAAVGWLIARWRIK